MSTKPGIREHLRAAFNARPIGMFIPPNWIGLAAFGFLGLINPGFWLVGLGLECGYLSILMSNERFRRLVAGSGLMKAKREWQAKINQLVEQLAPEGKRRYIALEKRCRDVLQQQSHGAAVPIPGLDIQNQGLARLLWVYLTLLVTRQAVDTLIQQSASGQDDAERLQERIRNLQVRLKEEKLGDELRKSLTGQVEILEQRLQKRLEARDKITFLDAELTRIQEQVELIHEQAVLATDPQVVSQRIDQITATLDGTTQWIREQQKMYGVVEDLLTEPPVLSASSPAKQSQ
jgi:hypothetical protein